MNILADENCGFTLLSALADAGHDVVAIRDVGPGMDDKAVFELAVTERRVLLTNDQDFGYIVERAMAQPPSVLLMRFPDDLSAVTRAEIVVRVISNLGDQLIGHFVVIEPASVRARPFKTDGDDDALDT